MSGQLYRLEGPALASFLEKAGDDEWDNQFAVPEMDVVIVEMDGPAPGGEVVGWQVLDGNGKQLPDEFMQTDFGSALCGEVIMRGNMVEDAPIPGIR